MTPIPRTSDEEALSSRPGRRISHGALIGNFLEDLGVD